MKAKKASLLTFEQWLKQFKPIQRNEYAYDGLLETCVFASSGRDLRRIKELPENKIWTLVKTGTHWTVRAGYHDKHCWGHFICKVPWKNRNQGFTYLPDRFVTSETTTESAYGEEEKWMLTVGAECNRLGDLADTLANSTDPIKRQYAVDIRSIIQRVGEFEELRTLWEPFCT